MTGVATWASNVQGAYNTWACRQACSGSPRAASGELHSCWNLDRNCSSEPSGQQGEFFCMGWPSRCCLRRVTDLQHLSSAVLFRIRPPTVSCDPATRQGGGCRAGSQLEKRQRFDQFVDCAVSEVERSRFSTIPRL